MAKVCTGSYYGADWRVYTNEDAIACANAGGHVVETADSGCGATSIAASMAAYPGNPSQGVVSELALTPLKLARQQFSQNELIQALVALNRAAAPDIERIAVAGKELQAEVAAAFATVSGLAAAVVQPSPRGKLEPEVFAGLEKLARRIAEHSSDQSVRAGIEQVLGLARPFVGQDFAAIANWLKGQQDGEASESSLELLLPSSSVVTATSTLYGLHALATIDIGKVHSVGPLVPLLAAEGSSRRRPHR